jgi:hypothetical protein
MERVVIAAGMHRIAARIGVLEMSWLPGLWRSDENQRHNNMIERQDQKILCFNTRPFSRVKLYVFPF